MNAKKFSEILSVAILGFIFGAVFTVLFALIASSHAHAQEMVISHSEYRDVLKIDERGIVFIDGKETHSFVELRDRVKSLWIEGSLCHRDFMASVSEGSFDDSAIHTTGCVSCKPCKK